MDEMWVVGKQENYKPCVDAMHHVGSFALETREWSNLPRTILGRHMQTWTSCIDGTIAWNCHIRGWMLIVADNAVLRPPLPACSSLDLGGA